MLLLETFETVGGIWLAISALAFILGAVFVKTRQGSSTSAAIETMARQDVLIAANGALPRRVDRLDDLRVASTHDHQLDHLVTAKKRPVSGETPARREKAA